MADNLFAKSFISRVKAGLSSSRSLADLAEWIVDNTRHPKDCRRPWTYEGHEYQIGIASDPANDLVIIKPSQVGASEIAVRMALGLIDIYPHSTAIYTLPTATDAALFAKGRFDTVVENSPELSAKMDKDVDNTSVKKIGTSFLYIRGTFSQRAAISIPADILIHDEVDFSSQDALTSYNSRLGHVKEDQVIKRRFSTPTIKGFGVSLLFEESTQHWYAVKCDHCGTWQVPEFLKDVVLPGFGRDLLKLEKEDLLNPQIKVNEAYVACPHCRGKLSVANLADPEKRMWVPARPGEVRAGYQVQPFDCPSINPPPRTLRFLGDYARKSDWVNFSVGQPYDDADTSFVSEAVKAAHCLEWVQPRPGAANGVVVGIDVGKVCHVVVALPTPIGMDVLHYERVTALNENTLADRAKLLFDWYGAGMLVIDAGPEWATALAVIRRLPAGRAFACYYGTPNKPTMSLLMEVDEEKNVVRVDRSGLISAVAKQVNGGMTRFCKCPDQALMEAHLDVIKKQRRVDGKGVEVEQWVNVGDRADHYGHALFFANVAKELLDYSPKQIIIPCLPLPGKIRFGVTDEGTHRASYLDRR